MTATPPPDEPLAAPHPSRGRRAVRATFRLGAMLRTLGERRRLMALDDRALKDIGLSRADAYGEWSRPFWDLPSDR